MLKVLDNGDIAVFGYLSNNLYESARPKKKNICD